MYSTVEIFHRIHNVRCNFANGRTGNHKDDCQNMLYSEYSILNLAQYDCNRTYSTIQISSTHFPFSRPRHKQGAESCCALILFTITATLLIRTYQFRCTIPITRVCCISHTQVCIVCTCSCMSKNRQSAQGWYAKCCKRMDLSQVTSKTTELTCAFSHNFKCKTVCVSWSRSRVTARVYIKALHCTGSSTTKRKNIRTCMRQRCSTRGYFLLAWFPRLMPKPWAPPEYDI